MEILEDVTTFDYLYDTNNSFSDVYRQIVETLVRESCSLPEGEGIAYAVPGSPMVAEKSVELLMVDDRVDIEIVPAMSFIDLAWERLRLDPVTSGVLLVDGTQFATKAAGEHGPILVSQCWSSEILSQIKLSVDLAGLPVEDGIVVLQRLGCDNEAVFEIDWNDLDRKVVPDHMTSLFIREIGSPVGREMFELIELARTLRQRCPWDRKQTHESLTKHLIEEAYEVVDAISELPRGAQVGDQGQNRAVAIQIGDSGFEHLKEELGDLLFQVIFHAILASEEGHFDLGDVAQNTTRKLIGRHPHVFGNVVAETAEEVVSNWEQIKKVEKGRSSIMDGITGSLPSLTLAYKIQKKAASVGFDWDDIQGPRQKISEELEEFDEAISFSPGASIRPSEELGDLLFSVVNLARHAGIDPENALRRASSEFCERFQEMEIAVESRGEDLRKIGAEDLDLIWEEVKSRRRGG